MGLSPLDIQQQQFDTSMFGFNRADVRAFLELIAQDVASQKRALTSLQRDFIKCQAERDALQAQEAALKETLLTLQKTMDTLKEDASSQAKNILQQANDKADTILLYAQQQIRDMEQTLRQLRTQKIQMVEELRCILATHARMLDHQETSQPHHQSSMNRSERLIDRLTAGTLQSESEEVTDSGELPS